MAAEHFACQMNAVVRATTGCFIAASVVGVDFAGSCERGVAQYFLTFSPACLFCCFYLGGAGGQRAQGQCCQGVLLSGGG